MPAALAQKNNFTYNGHFYCKSEGIHLHLDLNNASLEVPGYEFLGQTHGFFLGNIYGCWLLTTFSIEKGKAVLRFSNDLGADTQNTEITLQNDSILLMKLTGNNHVRKVEKKKLVKIPTTLQFIKVQ